MKLTRLKTTAVLAASVSLGLAGCATSDRTTDSGSATGSGSSTASGGAGDTFTFGAAGAPEVFDPYYASDGETFRVTRQIFQGLLGIKPGTADAQPELAESLDEAPSTADLAARLHLSRFHVDRLVRSAADAPGIVGAWAPRDNLAAPAAGCRRTSPGRCTCRS